MPIDISISLMGEQQKEGNLGIGVNAALGNRVFRVAVADVNGSNNGRERFAHKKFSTRSIEKDGAKKLLGKKLWPLIGHSRPVSGQ
ncbi:hypothetical protein [Paraburkholderia elongata]|uniref:Uncharacterized protein n=1 Tax=Paraburkholderia elongata TaxID=2675747 RepID=A0A972P1K5_9BURK|nr:hypothetical protein [Paraburkholderia elongata]NPT62469.1 hypothetical protein [Paraburkholderia elongata]